MHTWAYRAALVHVGRTPRGKENYAPVVRYVDDAEHVTAKAEATSKGRKLTKNQRHMIELVVRIETRDRGHYVPTRFLQESGGAAHREPFSGLGDMPVNGVLVADLQQLVQSRGSERYSLGGRSVDGFRGGTQAGESPRRHSKTPSCS